MRIIPKISYVTLIEIFLHFKILLQNNKLNNKHIFLTILKPPQRLIKPVQVEKELLFDMTLVVLSLFLIRTININ